MISPTYLRFYFINFQRMFSTRVREFQIFKINLIFLHICFTSPTQILISSISSKLLPRKLSFLGAFSHFHVQLISFVVLSRTNNEFNCTSLFFFGFLFTLRWALTSRQISVHEYLYLFLLSFTLVYK